MMSKLNPQPDNENNESNLAKAEGKPVVPPSDLSPAQSANEAPSQVTYARTKSMSIKFSGPIPHPAILAEYNAVIPNGAERIVAMAERQEAHRQSLEKAVIVGNARRSDWGLILGFVIAMTVIVGGICLIATGHSVEGITAILAPLAILAGTFIYAKTTSQKELLERSKTLTEKNKTTAN